MKNLFTHIRFFILFFSILLSVAIYGWVAKILPQGTTQIAKLVEWYGLLTLIYLYATLLAGPLCYTFRFLPFRGMYIRARRALGVSSFYFALLHSVISLFGQLGGFSGLGFLSTNYLSAVIIGLVALILLFLLTITSFDYAVTKLSFPRWKLLHRLVYIAGILILIHTVMLGTHFSDLSGVIPQITFVALSFLLFLEAPRVDAYIGKYVAIPTFGVSSLVVTICLSIFFVTYIYPVSSPTGKAPSFDIHAAHKQLAEQALQATQITTTSSSNNFSNMPGLNGDRTLRYTVSMTNIPELPKPNEDVTLHFRVFDASSGTHIAAFRILYEKPMHFIIANSDLTYFSHIHPTFDNQDFVITTQFPKADMYHLYITFQPFGGIEQQMAFTLQVGQASQPILSKTIPDTDQSKTFGDYTVSVDTHGGLHASAMTLGQQTISFMVREAKTGKPVTTLKPYLASFGHLTMIKQDSFDFIHVHPYVLIPPKPNENGGPMVDFLPIGIYGPFKPGIYRAFAEFNPDGHLFVADFTIAIK